jgi:quinol monooxygenase YgiN
MIRATIRMLIPAGKQKEALEILNSMVEEIQFETGCISCRLYRGVKDNRAIMVEELWECEEDVWRHLRSKKYGKILMVIEMASEFPEIRFDIISGSSGVETIEQARSIA